MPDELRVLPTWAPEGAEVSSAVGNHSPTVCPDTAPTPADDAMILRSPEVDPTGAVQIFVRGPLPRPLSEDSGVSQEPTQLRGQDAIRMIPGFDDRNPVTFAWTEPDGWSWEVSGWGVEERTIRAVAEALTLDSSPEGEEPTAALSPEDVPAGFEVAWQTLGTPTPIEADTTNWSVVVGVPQAVQTGVLCHLDVNRWVGETPFSVRYEGERVAVNGQDGVWTTTDPDVSPTGLGNGLAWEISPGVVATADCSVWDDAGGSSLPRDTVVQFAESVEPVAADDPRLPDPAG